MVIEGTMPLTRIATVALLAIILGLNVAYARDEDRFAECMLENVKSGMSDMAVKSVRAACAHRATPKKCRILQPHDRSPYGDPVVGSKEDCEDECRRAGYFSRRFGDCSVG